MSRLALTVAALAAVATPLLGSSTLAPLRTQAAGAHPDLLFSAADVPGLQSRITSGVPAQAWTMLKEKADAFTDPTNPSYIDPTLISSGHSPYDGFFGQNQMGSVLTDLGMAYTLSGDSRYGSAAVGILLALATAGFPAWDSNALGRGDLSKGMALAFDETYALMTSSQVSSFTGAIAAHETTLFDCLQPGFPLTENNWAGVCGGGEGLLLLAISGESGAPADTATLLTTARNRVYHYLQIIFGSQGDGQEGLSYAAYGLHNALPFAAAYKRINGEDLVAETPALQNVPRWLAYEQLPGQGLRFVPRNDGGVSLPLWQEVLPMFFGVRADGLTSWVWDHTIGPDGDDTFGNPPPAYLGTSQTGAPLCTSPVMDPNRLLFCWNNREVFTILDWQSITPADPSTVTSDAMQYPEFGLVDVRSGWSGGADEMVTTFEAKRNATSEAHFQQDEGQFTIYGEGAQLAVDSGYGHDYSCNTSEYQVYRVTQGGCPTTYAGSASGHNVVTVDCDGVSTQWGRGGATTSQTIPLEMSSPGTAYVRSDLSTAYSATDPPSGVPIAARDLLVSHVAGEPYVVAVRDALDTNGALHDWCWTLHTSVENAVALTGAQTFLVRSPDGVSMAGAVASSSHGTGGTTVPQLSVQPQANDFDQPVEQWVLSSEVLQTAEYDGLGVLAVSGINGAAPGVSVLTSTGGSVIDVTWSGGEMLLAGETHNAGPVSSARLHSDGLVAAATLGRGEETLDQGTSLVVDGVSVVSITGGPGSVTVSEGAATASGPTGAVYTVYAPGGLTSATVNGTAVNTCVAGSSVQFPC
ncbi:MAG TPA: heparinase II/III family protein [Candidatus Dormibacteraeota bacterium]|nr:heparinase II/III family protein [Candidatus Dormibacteraeota bacterium]